MFKYLITRLKCIRDLLLSLDLTCKFIIITFFLLFIPIGLSAAGLDIDQNGNMITIRTMFSSLFGYLIENTSRPPHTINSIDLSKSPPSMSPENCPFSQNHKYELRILIIGSLLVVIILILLLGLVVNTNQHSKSMIMLKNTAFSCIGFLISSARDNFSPHK